MALENEKFIKLTTNLLDITESEVDGRFASSKTFKRDYVVAKRKEFIDKGQKFDDNRDEQSKMDDWKEEAQKIFFKDGDYKVYPDGKVQWLGEY